MEEKLHLFTIFLSTLFSSLTLLSSAYTPAVEYFINCGSQSASTLEPGRSFVGDFPPLIVSGTPVKDSTASSANTTLYQTARVFQKQKDSWYRFEINRQGIYIIRLHFFAFSSSEADLSTAIFHVKASGFTLLSDFTTRKTASPVIEEFLLPINRGKFFIFFIPSNESSIAYVNAIEVFLAPERFIPNNTVKVTDAGSKGNQTELLFKGLHKIHRINVGGSMWTGSNSDTLWRDWIKDDDFLSYPETGKDVSLFTGSLGRRQWATEEIAPDFVYKTAKELKQENVSNITWGFDVRKNSIHLVRVHFCDITGEPLGSIIFNLLIYTKFSKKISPYDATNVNASPFYFDFVVESDSSGFMNISVSKRNDSNVENAFLNGLEIMEIIDPDVPRNNKKNRQVLFIIVSSVSMLFILVMIVALLVFFKIRKSKPYRKAGRPFSMALYGGSSHLLPPELNLELKIPYSEIQQATKNFSSKLLIGEGGFGKVYKGVLRHSQNCSVKVAVKRSEPGHGQGIAEFQTEIIILSQIRHRHLVPLIGYCDERSEMILVYEFMGKGTLREHLYISDSENNSTPKSELSWEQRLKICIDSAKGIHYLHTGLPNRIIHRDLKSTNILLSEDYTAKVADFGLSKSGPYDPDDENTGSLKGSFGYLDPEYFMTSQLTEKSDVYSFGVVLLEVVCARPAIINSGPTEEMNLAEWGMNWQKKGQLETIIDPCLVGMINPHSLRKFGETAEKCLRGRSSERPGMQDVIWDLEFSLGLQNKSMSNDKDDMSMTSNSLDPLALQIVEHLTSRNVAIREDDSFAVSENSSTYTMPSGVFSELGINAGR